MRGHVMCVRDHVVSVRDHVICILRNYRKALCSATSSMCACANLVHLLQHEPRPALNEPADIGPASGLVRIVQHQTEGGSLRDGPECAQEVVGLKTETARYALARSLFGYNSFTPKSDQC